jgi:ATP-dependent DNA helicase PIF1
MTIPNLEVGLSGVFEYGQGYVALSRATKMSSLRLRNFDDRSFRAHPKVKLFYNVLDSAQKEWGTGAPKAGGGGGGGGGVATTHASATQPLRQLNVPAGNSFSGSHKRTLSDSGGSAGKKVSRGCSPRDAVAPPLTPARRSR